MSPHQAPLQIAFSIRCGLFLLALWALTLYAPTAHAQTDRILLLSQSQHYQQGERIAVYAFFFRMPEQFSFFRVWERALQSNQDFTLRKTERLSIVQEYGRDTNGFPSESYNALYRLELEPKRLQGTLQYGPLRLQSLVSNSLRFAPQSATPRSSIQSEVSVLTPTRQQGTPLQIRYRFRCPLALCNYDQLDQNDLIQHLRQKAQLSDLQGLWPAQTNVTPEVLTSTSHLTIQYTFTFYPTRSGSLPTPRLRVPIPTLQALDFRPIQHRITQWLQSTHNIPAPNAQRYIQIERNNPNRIQLQTEITPPLSLEIAPVLGCPGQWKLHSRLVTPEKSNAVYWEISLRGDGFLLLALPALRRTLQDLLAQHKLSQTLELAHAIWRAPQQDLHQQIEIAYYFALPSQRPALPAISMSFLNAQNQPYTQQTPAIERNARVVPLNETFAPAPNDRRIYLYYDRAPTTEQSEQAEIWAYQLPEGFPLPTLLSQRWSLKQPPQIKHERKVRNITRRHQTRGMFGMMTQVVTQGVPLDVHTAQTEAMLRSHPLARVFPTVYWGSQRLSIQEETGSGLTLSAQTSQKRYFVGEDIEYKAELQCPPNECTPKTPGFYKQIFQKHLKLPSFDRFSGWQKLDDFTRRDLPDGRTSFTYRIRFKTNQSGPLSLPSTSLRLPEQVLQSLQAEHQVCFFRGGRAEERLASAIMRDHMNLKGEQECATGTQEIETTPIQISIETLPAEARDIKLVGIFRLQATLSQLNFPTKQATVADKPFYLLIDISGDGDLKTAQQIIQDQLAQITRDLRKKDVTAYTEIPPDEQKPDRLRVQLQLIAEQPTTLVLPSLSLRYYHREEGVLTAQTLPLSVRIEPRDGISGGVTPRKAEPPPTPKETTSLLQETDLRPNIVLSQQEALVDQSFSPWHGMYLSLLAACPLLLLLFAGWQRQQRLRAADPTKQIQQKALHRARQALKQAQQHDAWERAALLALQTYLTERLNLRQKHPTSDEIKQFLARQWPEYTRHDCAKHLLSHLQALEDALYGGSQPTDAKTLLPSVEQAIKDFDRQCPR